MARDFDAATSQYLSAASTPITAAPFTFACWAKLDQLPSDLGSTMQFMGISNGTTNHYFAIFSHTANDQLYIKMDGDGPPAEARTVATVTAGVWQHYCGVAAAADSRAIYIDGGNKVSNSDSSAPSGVDELGIGAFGPTSPLNYVDGVMAECTFWNVALTDAEVLELAQGYSSKFIRPGSIVARWSLHGDDKDEIGGYHLTPVNGPTQVDGPRLVYPSLVF